MRQFKYRAKQYYNGKWVYGSSVIFCDDCCYMDKNGKEIYEGDFIRSFDSNHNEILHYIEWKETEARFVAILVKPTCDSDMPISNSISQEWIDEFEKEVIGDIYDIVVIRQHKLLNK